MYKAIKEIGGYQVGDEIPTVKALVWKDMYAVTHVEEVNGEHIDTDENLNPEKNSSILEDYLARGSNVVRKNVAEDNLSNEQLEELLRLEKSDKNRSAVIFAIEKRLGN